MAKRSRRAFFWLRRREDIAREVNAEFALHIELTVEELIAEGMDAVSAREEAERRFGNLGYNTARGLSAFSWDASLHKVFNVNEQHRITFRFEAFNWLNHTLLGNPTTNLAAANFGFITTLAGDSRNIQFGLKYNF